MSPSVESGRNAGGPLRPVASHAEIRAPAKVNLVLRVLARDQATGYHRLETVFQAVDLEDRLVVEVTPGPSPVVLDVTGADLGPPEANLVTRAARAFLARTGARTGLRIGLEKRIPAGAGLGGGSSDAAATLRALNALFGEPLEGAVLHELAASLGSDVPFFLCGSPTALGWDRGDRLRPLPPLPRAPLLLVLPEVHVATGEAYAALAAARDRRGVAAGEPFRERWGEVGAVDWDTVVARAVNDFEAVVPAAHDGVSRALEGLRATAPRLALLSGSGSGAFGVYDTVERAAAARARLEEEGHRVVRADTLERMPEPLVGPNGLAPG